MNLIYQNPPAKTDTEIGEEKVESIISLIQQKKGLIISLIISAVIAILLFFVLKYNGNYYSTIYLTKDPTLGFIFNLLLVLTALFLCLWLIAKIKFAKTISKILVIIDVLFILFFVTAQKAFGAEALSSVKSFIKESARAVGKGLCYLKPENIATGNYEECEPKDAKKEGKYENLEVVFGIKNKGKVEDTNVQPVSNKPYKLDITLTNLNQEKSTVFGGSIYNIEVKKIRGYASAYSFASVDFSDYREEADAELNREFIIEPGVSEWVRLEFNELPCCLGMMYFHVRVTTRQIGSGKSTIGIVPWSANSEDEEEMRQYKSFVRTFDKSASMSPGPVNVYVLSNPAVISKPDLGSDTFSIVLKIKNMLEGSAKLLDARIISPFDYIDISKCSSSEEEDVEFSRCSDASNCVEITLENEPVIKELQTFEIECQARILQSEYTEYDKKGLISAEVTYEYTIDDDYKKSGARCECSPSGTGDGSSNGGPGSCPDLTEKCPTGEKLLQKIACEAKKEGVPADIMLGIAHVESGGSMTHCTSNGDVKIGSYGEIGLMQILPDTMGCGKDYLSDINNNIRCSIKILKDKCSYSQNSNINNGIGICNPTGICTDSSVKCTYNCPEFGSKEYSGWDIAIRGYNGWGCGPTEANRRYVELVKQYATQYRRYV